MNIKLICNKVNFDYIIIIWLNKVYRNLYFFISNFIIKINFYFRENLDEVYFLLYVFCFIGFNFGY